MVEAQEFRESDLAPAPKAREIFRTPIQLAGILGLGVAIGGVIALSEIRYRVSSVRKEIKDIFTKPIVPDP